MTSPEAIIRQAADELASLSCCVTAMGEACGKLSDDPIAYGEALKFLAREIDTRAGRIMGAQDQ